MKKVFEYIKKYDILIFIIIAFLLYTPALSFDFLGYDDFSLILENQYLNGIKDINFYQFFIPKFVRDDIYIPLTFLVYWSIIKIFGISSLSFHFINILFFILSSIALFCLLKRIIKNYFVAFWAVIFYILHPCHIESTAWISAMGYNIAGLFFFLSFLNFIIAFDENKKINYIYSLVFYILSILSQPIAVTLPAILFLWVYCFRRDRLKESIKYICSYILFGFVYLYLFKQTVSDVRIINSLGYNYINKMGFIGQYLFNVFIPINLSPFQHFPNLLSVIYLFIFAILFFCFRNKIKSLFYIISLIICILPYSNIFFPVSFEDRYLILASSFSCVLLSYFLFYILEKFKDKKILKNVSFFSFIILYLFSFILYLPVWKDDRNLWIYSYNYNSSDINVKKGYAKLLIIDEKYDEALVIVNEMIRQYPINFDYYELKIKILIGKKEKNELIDFCNKLKNIFPNNYKIYLYFFDIYIDLQDYSNAQKSLEIAYIKAKEHDLFKNEIFNSLLNKSLILNYVLVEPDKFIEIFKSFSNDFKLMQDNGEFSNILNEKDYKSKEDICLNYLKNYTEYSKSVIRLLSCLYMREIYKDKAPQVMKSILKEMNKAEEFIKNGDNDSAEQIYLSIISKNKYMYIAYNNLGILYLQTNRKSEAKEKFLNMLKVNPNDDQVKQILMSL